MPVSGTDPGPHTARGAAGGVRGSAAVAVDPEALASARQAPRARRARTGRPDRGMAERYVPVMADLHDLSALEQAAAIRSGETSSTDLVEHYAQRIDKLDGDIGAFVTLTVDTAREQAAAADRAVKGKEALPPLHGVPIRSE